jgi:hypothetical protein
MSEKQKEFTIQKGIPIPEKVGPQRAMYSPLTLAMQKMEVGDCIDLAFNATHKAGVYSRAKKLGIELEIRTLDNGQAKMLRVWRTK